MDWDSLAMERDSLQGSVRLSLKQRELSVLSTLGVSYVEFAGNCENIQPGGKSRWVAL